MDATVVATALPRMADSFGENVLTLNLAITSYIIGAAVFLPVSGWAADRFGARTIFQVAIVTFVVASSLCALSQNLSQLVAARKLQGFGGAMLLPVGRLILLKTTPKDQLVNAMAYLTIPAMLGPVCGPLLGGSIVTYLSWRWIFLINVPIGLVGLVLVTRYIDNIREEACPPLDIRGLLLSAVALACLGYGLENIGRPILPALAVVGLLVAGSAGAGLYAVHARRAQNPILDLSLFRIATFSASTLGGFFARLLVGAAPFLLNLLFQVAFGMSPVAAGGLIFAGAVGALLMRVTALRVYGWLGFRRVLIINGVLTAASFMAFGLFRPETPHLLMSAVLLTHGFLRSLQLTGLNTLAYADLPKERMAPASTLSGVGQLLAQTVAIGGSAVLLHALQAASGSTMLRAEHVSPVFAILGALTLVSLAWYVRLPPKAGDILHKARR